MIPDIGKDTFMEERVSTQEVWHQMENCRENGLCRSLGVMNCPVVMLLEILTFCEVKPAINFIELHPYFTQEDVVDFHKKLGIPVAAYAPLCPQKNPFCP